MQSLVSYIAEKIYPRHINFCIKTTSIATPIKNTRGCYIADLQLHGIQTEEPKQPSKTGPQAHKHLFIRKRNEQWHEICNCKPHI
jgi:hypothetical protein